MLDIANGDHPRMRGEKERTVEDDFFCGGSPPHARGKGARRWASARMCRITPACAGKRDEEAAGYTIIKDHPRMRGEKACLHKTR